MGDVGSGGGGVKPDGVDATTWADVPILMTVEGENLRTHQM